MTAVSNSSPLIFLSKIDDLMELAKEIHKNILISEEVYKEVVEIGLLSEKPSIKNNALKIKQLASSGFIKTIKLKPHRLKHSLSERLGIGEASAICLALQENIKEVLIDEKAVTVVAKELGLKPLPISSLPIIAFKNGMIKKEAAERIIDKLVLEHYYLNASDYKLLIRLLE
ncbi:MAG: hypothetical protein HY513_02915 [Candidatus Aenigmarchaeota archaeon]|nr:hypothetical protein [Candidatus Aenigmarchaeota archaeon]